jgi:8-hydroxy-5-deazaflavin:NADPH oxidoreductase
MLKTQNLLTRLLLYKKAQMKKIGIIGSGVVGKTLAGGFHKHGFEVMLGSGDQSKREEFASETGIMTGSFSETALFADIVVIAVKGDVAEKVAISLLREISGKTVIDTTNPIDEKPPVNGVLRFFTTLDNSLMERLQKAVPNAHFVKAFSCVGNAFMIDPTFEQKPTMFICGNNDGAKKDVATLLEKVGWEPEDMGSAESARAIEPLCMLWCIPGMRENRWNHAFKLLKR